MSPVPGRFGSVLTAMVTPFDDQGRLDVDGAASLAKWLTENGSDALVVAGSTGESTVLSDDEKAELWRAVAGAVNVPVIAGAGTADTRHSVELTRSAADAGAAGILAVAPYYSRPSQAGIEAHITAMAEGSELPVIVYDIPVRTGRKIAASTLLSLATKVPNVVAVKDAGGNPAASARLLAEAPGGFELYSGDDSLTLPLLAVGASGVIGVATHWAGREFAEMISAFASGAVETARSINARLIDSYDFESSDDAPNPAPAKAMMRIMGLPAGQCRLPIGPAPLALEHRARAVLARLRRDSREARTAEAASPETRRGESSREPVSRG